MNFGNSWRRRDLWKAALPLASAPAVVGARARQPFAEISRVPDAAVAYTEEGTAVLNRKGTRWEEAGISVVTEPDRNALPIRIRAPQSKLLHVHLRWQVRLPADLVYLGDQWSRSYGDLGWRSLDPERVMPWYFLATEGRSTLGCGVKTQPSAWCFWRVDSSGISLWLDLRNGGSGVILGERELHAASVVSRWFPETKPFTAAKQFCRVMSEQPRLPAQPVYGGNNWYYAYGKSSAGAIREDSERIASLSPHSANRPFMIVDDGWAPNPTAGPWSRGNERFPDMAQLASDMRSRGVRPGLWIRPLFTKEAVPSSWCVSSPNATREKTARNCNTLDPTVPEAAESVAQDLSSACGWGFDLLKHDFSTYDLLGRWGNNMGAEVTEAGWNFHDRSLTNGEVIRNLYQLIRKSAGEAMLIGCDTVGHLSTGLFELSRIGDDTSGRDWNRTRRMGVNTLAFRAPQHGTFFAADADCVGITKQIPWQFNRQWLDLLAKSGTPLFVSAAPDAIGSEQRSALTEAFARASQPQPLIEPLDWLWNTQPEQWSVQGHTVSYDWFGTEGVSFLG